MKVTLSVIKANICGFIGHSDSHPECIATAEDAMAKANKDSQLKAN